jgi:hypothetical protein
MGISMNQSIICKLGGHVNSNPELVISYPPIKGNIGDPQEAINECLPFGCKAGDFIEKKYKKNTLIAIIFTVDKTNHRDDLFSFSILLNKKEDADLYKAVIQEFIQFLKKNKLLKEKMFLKYQELIYNGLNQEEDIEIENVSIPLSTFFDEKREDLGLKFEPKGSFF